MGFINNKPCVRLFEFMKKHPVTMLLVVAIWVVCMVPVPETPLNDVAFVDKWTHLVMYMVLSAVVAVEHWHVKRRRQAPTGRNDNSAAPLLSACDVTLLVWLFPVVMGGVIELVQAYCTGGNRSGDWMDFLADGAGSTLVALLTGILLAVCRARA